MDRKIVRIGIVVGRDLPGPDTSIQEEARLGDGVVTCVSVRCGRGPHVAYAERLLNVIGAEIVFRLKTSRVASPGAARAVGMTVVFGMIAKLVAVFGGLRPYRRLTVAGADDEKRHAHTSGLKLWVVGDLRLDRVIKGISDCRLEAGPIQHFQIARRARRFAHVAVRRNRQATAFCAVTHARTER